MLLTLFGNHLHPVLHNFSAYLYFESLARPCFNNAFCCDIFRGKREIGNFATPMLNLTWGSDVVIHRKSVYSGGANHVFWEQWADVMDGSRLCDLLQSWGSDFVNCQWPPVWDWVFHYIIIIGWSLVAAVRSHSHLSSTSKKTSHPWELAGEYMVHG